MEDSQYIMIDTFAYASTPTPWAIDGDRGVIYGTAPADSDEVEVCELLHNPEDFERCAADGSLLRAAPEMFTLLRQAAGRVAIANADGNPILSAWLPDAEALLVRIAEGERRA